MIPAMVRGRFVIRFCVTYEHAVEEHIGMFPKQWLQSFIPITWWWACFNDDPRDFSTPPLTFNNHNSNLIPLQKKHGVKLRCVLTKYSRMPNLRWNQSKCPNRSQKRSSLAPNRHVSPSLAAYPTRSSRGNAADQILSMDARLLLSSIQMRFLPV